MTPIFRLNRRRPADKKLKVYSAAEDAQFGDSHIVINSATATTCYLFSASDKHANDKLQGRLCWKHCLN